MTISGFQTFLVVSLSALIGLSACSHTPEGVLTEKQMRDVMIDLYTAEAMIYDDPQRFETFEQRRALFNDVFAKHHLTEAQYDSSLMWYGHFLRGWTNLWERMPHGSRADSAAAFSRRSLLPLMPHCSSSMNPQQDWMQCVVHD